MFSNTVTRYELGQMAECCISLQSSFNLLVATLLTVGGEAEGRRRNVHQMYNVHKREYYHTETDQSSRSEYKKKKKFFEKITTQRRPKLRQPLIFAKGQVLNMNKITFYY